MIAIERKERLYAFQGDVRAQAYQHGVHIETRAIHSIDRNNARYNADGERITVGSTNVRKDVEALPHVIAPDTHVVVIVTHEALKSADLDAFAGWHLVIDETPDIWDSQTLKVEVEATRTFLRDNYELVPVTDGRSYLKPRRALGAIDQVSMTNDTIFSTLSTIHARIQSPSARVTTDLTSWDDLAKKTSMSISSIWSPETLLAFSTVTILANAFTESVTYGLYRSFWPDIEWQDLARKTVRRFAHRKVIISYYVEAHQIGRHFVDTGKGGWYLQRIAEDICKRIGDDDHIWMSNPANMPFLRDLDGDAILPGNHLGPRQAGSNKYAHVHSSTMLYTAKPTTDEARWMDEIGISPDMIVQSREREIMLQFACRTSVRKASSTATVCLYVYDKAQADYLASYFVSTEYCHAETNLIDLGFAHDVAKTPAGRPRVVRTLEEKRAMANERVKRHRAKAKAQKAKAKTLGATNLASQNEIDT
ncbi:hypothetical protein [Novosphingobium mangrovi (ex Hu et al. 2023)]|uniref:Uncharacterized protein n=1 Tax=Novosphingobium mangrovi (ex Hu et al. 2023) TaxID=2930094 RepID=A0ABT0AG70_9SPHN|nr:hypothetical protein [Novosphingobium mangrovi (ex Hu et al. 2023)]MCJ1962187.1 hypothetical protein [Novosphingobium mangrovi (ex Hu et al. 2023)]